MAGGGRNRLSGRGPVGRVGLVALAYGRSLGAPTAVPPHYEQQAVLVADHEQVVESSEGWVPADWGTVAGGGFDYVILVPVEAGIGAIGLYFPHAGLGLYYAPLDQDEPWPYPRVSREDCLAGVRRDHGCCSAARPSGDSASAGHFPFASDPKMRSMPIALRCADAETALESVARLHGVSAEAVMDVLPEAVALGVADREHPIRAVASALARAWGQPLRRSRALSTIYMGRAPSIRVDLPPTGCCRCTRSWMASGPTSRCRRPR